MNPLYNTNSRMPRPAQSPFQLPGQADTFLSRNWQETGQISPYARNTLMSQSGRYLSGFGDVNGPSGPAGDPDVAGAAVDQMEREDDTAGSGIFDQPGAGPTANANMTVFASYYSLPGYLARERPFAVSKDEFDATSDAPIVTIPSGGLPLVSSSRAFPGAGSKREEVYVTIPQRPLPPPSAAETVGPDYHGVRRDPGNAYIRPLPQSQGVKVRPSITSRPVGARSNSIPRDATLAISPTGRRVPPVAGFGASSGGTSIGEYAVAGAIVGAALFWLYKSVKGETEAVSRRTSGAGW